MLGSANLLDGLGGIESSNVENVLVGRCIDEVDLSLVRVSVGSSSGWGDEDGSREVVAQDVYATRELATAAIMMNMEIITP